MVDAQLVQLEHGFRIKLINAAKAIRAEAAGRTCGSCRYYVGAGCSEHESPVTGWPIQIYTPDAVACGGFQPS